MISQNSFYVSPGTVNLVSMTISILNTTTSALDFDPLSRDCYTDTEFDFQYLKYEFGFHYSMQNCLYEAVLQKILQNCSCKPKFVSFKLKNKTDVTICSGQKLICANRYMDDMGNGDIKSEMGNLAIANDAQGISKICLERCEFQDQHLLSTATSYPNRQAFPYSTHFCLVLKKVHMLCKDPLKRIALEEAYETDIDCNEIDQLIEGPNKICEEPDKNNPARATMPDIKANPKIVNFVFKYARENVAILRIFIKDPYYTSITKDEKIPFLTFIGNTGGLLGLSIGLSAVSIFEMFFHMIRFIIESCRLKCKCKF